MHSFRIVPIGRKAYQRCLCVFIHVSTIAGNVIQWHFVHIVIIRYCLEAVKRPGAVPFLK